MVAFEDRLPRWPKAVWRLLLIALAILALGHYFNWGRGIRPNRHEFFHYYLGAKYCKEIGYRNLYAAALLADEQSGGKFTHKSGKVRDLTSGLYVPVARFAW